MVEDDNEAAAELLRGISSVVVKNMMVEQNEMIATKSLSRWIYGICKMPAPATDQIHVLVVPPVDHVSKRLKADEFSPLNSFLDQPIKEEEFQLDTFEERLINKKSKADTSGLHSFWQNFGNFPKSYYIRKEEVMLWKVIKKMLSDVDKTSIVIVGSPGVGKSCFLMLVAFYLAFIKKKKVLIVRKMKEGVRRNAMIYLDGQGKFKRRNNLSASVIDDVCKPGEHPGVLLLVDGFTQA